MSTIETHCDPENFAEGGFGQGAKFRRVQTLKEKAKARASRFGMSAEQMYRTMVENLVAEARDGLRNVAHALHERRAVDGISMEMDAVCKFCGAEDPRGSGYWRAEHATTCAHRRILEALAAFKAEVLAIAARDDAE